nr:MAG TPA: hypothetical protein [Caudoviricetes sp.]
MAIRVSIQLRIPIWDPNNCHYGPPDPSICV